MNYSQSGLQSAITNQKAIAQIIKERDAILNGGKRGFFAKLLGGRK